MTHLDAAAIKKIALLARLEIKDDEIAVYQRELSAILALVEQVQSTDTSLVEPISHPQVSIQGTRHDVVTAIVNPTQQKALQSISPQTEQGLYVVPQIKDVE